MKYRFLTEGKDGGRKGAALAAAEGMSRQRKAPGRIGERRASWAPLCCSGSFSRRSPESRREAGAAPVSQRGKSSVFNAVAPTRLAKHLQGRRLVWLRHRAGVILTTSADPEQQPVPPEVQVTPSPKVDARADGGEKEALINPRAWRRAGRHVAGEESVIFPQQG